MLKVGDRVPNFALASDTVGEVKTADLLGKRFVLYFYPNDDTPGCTIEACDFRDNLPDFSAIKVPVYGISPNDLNSHAKFRTKYGLTFPLLADHDHAIAEAFGVWVEKNNYGKTYMGIQRSTFIIGADGRIEHVWEKVKPADHAKDVLAQLRNAPVAAPAAPVVAEQAVVVTLPATPAVVAKKAVVKKAATKKAAAKKPAAKKAAVKKVPAKKKAVKKVAAKKVAAKKTAR
jgi:thioredoxin-dependent peroxiredoxin